VGNGHAAWGVSVVCAAGAGAALGAAGFLALTFFFFHWLFCSRFFGGWLLSGYFFFSSRLFLGRCLLGRGLFSGRLLLSGCFFGCWPFLGCWLFLGRWLLLSRYFFGCWLFLSCCLLGGGFFGRYLFGCWLFLGRYLLDRHFLGGRLFGYNLLFCRRFFGSDFFLSRGFFLRSCHGFFLLMDPQRGTRSRGWAWSGDSTPHASHKWPTYRAERGCAMAEPNASRKREYRWASTNQSQFNVPPVWYSITRVSKKLRSFFKSIISLIHGNGFSSFGKSASSPICTARRLAM